MSAPPRVRPWWQPAIVYQIYPASFRDTNGDGLGDLRGIINSVDYIRSLGADAIWLSPMYASPQKDMGYDISDYESVHPPYGTMKDMNELIAECHNKGLRILLDLVINHTSTEHAWFRESASSKTNPKADWYIWRDSKYINGVRQPPNNWRSFFGDTAWEYVPARDQYYLHLFVTEQADVNWECDAARQALYESAMRFWLEKGVDGFRVDTANIYSKDQTFADGPDPSKDVGFGAPLAEGTQHAYINGPRIHEWYQEIRAQVLDDYPDAVMVGELGGTPLAELLRYIHPERRELNMVLDMEVVKLGGNWEVPKHMVRRPTLVEFKAAWAKLHAYVDDHGAWSTVFLENHDQPRSIPRFCQPEKGYEQQCGKVLATLLATLSGTLFLYQGQEVGMMNMPEEWTVEDMRDVDAKNYWKAILEEYPGDEGMQKRALTALQYLGRDNSRTPLQWVSS